MLSIFGSPYRNCDGVTRRDMLTVGSMGLGGLTLPQLLQAEEEAGIDSSQKAVINVHLDGGPAQMDMIDLKPDAPVEIRGEFQPIASKVPGINISEHMPNIARLAEKFVFVRSLVGSAGRHDAFQCQSGFRTQDLQSIGGRPTMGCVITKLRGSATDLAPTFVDLMQGRALVRNSARPGFLGPSYKPFRPDISHLFKRELERGMKGELARLGGDHQTSLSLNADLSLDRLKTRQQLLNGLDKLRREVDASGMMDAMDRFTQQAVGILTSGRFAEAMDISREDSRTLELYSLPTNKHFTPHTTSDGPAAVRKMLLARRLIEAGVRCVSISISDFDTHRDNFNRMRNNSRLVDYGLSALVTDLDQRGMLDNTSIVVWGEFGRTPRIDAKTVGRHHWPRVGMAMLAGGGMRTGQVIGSTDKTAGTPKDRPVTYKDVFATLYHNLGIDPHNTTLTDPQGRPQYLLDGGQPLRELV